MWDNLLTYITSKEHRQHVFGLVVGILSGLIIALAVVL
jgi:hypothetical protein